MLKLVRGSKITKTIPINMPLFSGEEVQAVTKVLKSGIVTNKSGSGPKVLQFERAFAHYVGVKYSLAFNNGTAALHASLLAADVGPEDEVIVPSFTFVATAECVALTGAKPVFVDIDPLSYCMDPESFRHAITGKTRAVIPVHLYGLPADMAVINEIAQKNELIVIEDAAQAHGAEYYGKKAGALGDMACFSFYASKNMTTGEGGMVTAVNRKFLEKLHLIRVHGESREYRSITIGHNYRLPEMEAAIGCVQLSKLPKFLEKRRKNAALLTEKLSDIKSLELPMAYEGRKHGWYVYTVRLKGANSGKRNKFVKHLNRRRVGAAVYYPVPIHKMPYYREQFDEFNLPNTEKASRQVFSLPVHPGIGEMEINHIAKTVEKALRKK